MWWFSLYRSLERGAIIDFEDALTPNKLYYRHDGNYQNNNKLLHGVRSEKLNTITCKVNWAFCHYGSLLIKGTGVYWLKGVLLILFMP